MNRRKAKQLREIANEVIPHVSNGYEQLKELYKTLPHKSRGRASKVMKLVSKKPIDPTLAATFCYRLFMSSLLYQTASRKVKPRPFYIRQQTGKRFKGRDPKK